MPMGFRTGAEKQYPSLHDYFVDSGGDGSVINCFAPSLDSLGARAWTAFAVLDLPVLPYRHCLPS